VVQGATASAGDKRSGAPPGGAAREASGVGCCPVRFVRQMPDPVNFPLVAGRPIATCLLVRSAEWVRRSDTEPMQKRTERITSFEAMISCTRRALKVAVRTRLTGTAAAMYRRHGPRVARCRHRLWIPQDEGQAGGRDIISATSVRLLSEPGCQPGRALYYGQLQLRGQTRLPSSNAPSAHDQPRRSFLEADQPQTIVSRRVIPTGRRGARPNATSTRAGP
jgi:hypothetical protein